VAQAQVVDVRGQPDPLGATGEERQVRENTGVLGGTGGCSSPGWGERDMCTGNTRCSGIQTDS
jgi:hypothetical protein